MCVTARRGAKQPLADSGQRIARGGIPAVPRETMLCCRYVCIGRPSTAPVHNCLFSAFYRLADDGSTLAVKPDCFYIGFNPSAIHYLSLRGVSFLSCHRKETKRRQVRALPLLIPPKRGLRPLRWITPAPLAENLYCYRSNSCSTY